MCLVLFRLKYCCFRGLWLIVVLAIIGVSVVLCLLWFKRRFEALFLLTFAFVLLVLYGSMRMSVGWNTVLCLQNMPCFVSVAGFLLLLICVSSQS